MSKVFWKSKTFWVNLIALVVIVSGKSQLDAGIIASILSGINIFLRFITKEEITWS